MTTRFAPRLDTLPQAQRRLWPRLMPTARLGFVLYGGTAIAIRLGHRQSVDFDFFSELPLNREALTGSMPFLGQATVLQDERNTLTMLVSDTDSRESVVKVSFFGAVDFGRVGAPESTADDVLQVASLDDLMATKLKVVLQRAEAKDYRDIAAMVEAGVDISRGLAAARAMFGPNFQPGESLKALNYFKDGDLDSLTVKEKSTLVRATSAVRELPTVHIVSGRLSDGA
jgi:hypothetical protein